MSVSVVIPAAGQGKRMGTSESKQFLKLHDQPIVLHTIDVFEKHPAIAEIVIVVGEAELQRMRELLSYKQYSTTMKVVTGGLERQESVYKGLQHTTQPIVLVHDAVRPFVTNDAITRLIAATEHFGAAILAVPTKDTIKKVEANAVSQTLERAYLWSVQTPQGFRRELLIEAHQHALSRPELATDDASLVEHLGQAVHVVDGEYTNIKITTPEDLIFAEAIYQMKG